jgi:hypothetical protein
VLAQDVVERRPGSMVLPRPQRSLVQTSAAHGEITSACSTNHIVGADALVTGDRTSREVFGIRGKLRSPLDMHRYDGVGGGSADSLAEQTQQLFGATADQGPPVDRLFARAWALGIRAYFSTKLRHANRPRNPTFRATTVTPALALSSNSTINANQMATSRKAEGVR